MGHLLGLANELLCDIVSYLEPTAPVPMCGCPFFHNMIDLEDNHRVPLELAKSLHSVALTCHRLHDIAITRLHHYIPLMTDVGRSELFLSALGTSRDSAARVKFVDINAMIPSHGAIDVRCLFSLPNVHTLCIRNFHTRYYRESLPEGLYVRSSPVKVLKLIGCGVSTTFLGQVLSWPRALKEFWYERTQDDSRDIVRGWPPESLEPLDFSCTSLVTAMSSQADSLEKFVLARQPHCHREIYRYEDDDALKLRNFKKLKSLFVDYEFLDKFHMLYLWELLPESLEELEVYTEEILSALFDRNQSNWLIRVLEHGVNRKRRSAWTPRLKIIRGSLDVLKTR
ncbi:hypothetical protein F4818DRAFT_370275 [Hypoxylon cercidicola]|nr:hypothetical protein F4818DRAFT_370275 [Hypoxylon cercidicola]